MNFHPKAHERGWRGHDVCWLSEKAFPIVKEFVTTYRVQGYKGNAQDALVTIIKDFQASGDAGPAPVDWWAFWFLTVCRDLDWYDPEKTPGRKIVFMAELGPAIPTGKGAV
jgi:hypothetical protein